MKFLHLGTVLSAAILSFLPCFHAPANAQDPDYTCFMTTESGQVIDLSKSVCGSKKKSVQTVSANSDQAVSAEFKRKFAEDKELRKEALRLIQTPKEKNVFSTADVENVPDPSATYMPR